MWKKIFEKNIHISESLCCIPVINTTLQINCTSIKKKKTKKNTQ